MSGDLNRYEIPGRPGHFIRGTEDYARAHGLIPGEVIDVEPQSEEAVERATPGPNDAVVTSASAPTAPRARVTAVDPSELVDEGGDDDTTKERPRSKKRAAPRPRRG